jgi:hypothetical protein
MTKLEQTAEESTRILGLGVEKGRVKVLLLEAENKKYDRIIEERERI